MMGIPIDPAADFAEILDDSSPPHPYPYHLWDLEPFPRTNGFGEGGVRSFQEFVVIAAQVHF